MFQHILAPVDGAVLLAFGQGRADRGRGVKAADAGAAGAKPLGGIEAEQVVTPGIFVERVVEVANPISEAEVLLGKVAAPAAVPGPGS